MILHGHSPNVSHLKILGCLAFASTLSASHDKVRSRAQQRCFL